jgi:hypothetical protein
LGESSHAKEEEVFWKELWKLRAPAVVKNFVWKVGNELLPTKGNLFRRKVIQDMAYPIGK